ncbi:hypothetical protein IPV09_07775 [Tessaracoccus sp. SD287]|uniref:hypothetical protein n=1 Tax=Tessaracoccus sp. SD287 TaxID=2782008 RepID=UPI001A968FCB|nr:hypothetical protein [Tessaracoccus sp. SD287]MBO1031235.1 hypothetical protein [Tessaracoccus sp. SD287]
MTSTDIESVPAQSPRKRRALVPFFLAVLAVGGVGAAATSAAWTDNTFFSGSAAGATFNLQGSLDGVTWKESASADSVQLVIPASQLNHLLPGQTRTIDLWVNNDSSVNAALTSTVAFASNSTFTTLPTVSISDLSATLTPTGSTGSSDKFQLVLTTPADWAASNQGATGTVTVTISGTATA